MGVALYDRVTNRKCGPIYTGVVKAISEGKFYIETVSSLPVSSFKGWAYHYPGWEGGLIALVHLDKPVRPISQQEAIGNGLDWELIPHTSVIMAPVADLIPVGEVV